MGPDLSIYQNLLRPPKSMAEYAAEMDAAEQNKLQLQGQRMNLLSAQRAEAEQQQLRQLYADPKFDARSDEGVASIFRISPKDGYAAQKARADALKSAADLTKTGAETEKERAQTQKTNIEAAGAKLQQYRGALDYIDTPEGAARWLQAQFNDPLIADQMAALGSFEQAVQRIPRDPAQFQQWRQQAAMGMEKHVEAMRKAAADAETKRSHLASEANTRRGQDMVDARAGERLKLDQEAPRGVVVQTDAGPVLADPRSGAATPVTVGGKPVGPKLASVPPQARSAMIANSQNLSKIDQAIKLVDGEKVGALEGDTAATGVKGYLPNGLLNRMDPKGVDTRAMISDIGSLVIHDRSGAAVTAAETPRLLPFIPLATDDKETVRKKLVRFKQLYEQEAQALANTYSKDAGYKAGGGASGSWDDDDIRAQADQILNGGN